MMVIQELILESEILRVENDNDGPQDELEYWKSRAAKLTLLVDQISSPECRMTLATLRAAQSRLLRVRISKKIFWNLYLLVDMETMRAQNHKTSCGGSRQCQVPWGH